MSLFGRRERREIAELNARVDRLRTERDTALADVETWHAAARQASELFTDTSIVNDHLTEDLADLKERLAAYGQRRTVPEVLEEHDVHRKALADALGPQKRHLNWDQLIAEAGRLNEAAEAWMADHAAEKKRADHLQRQLDDAVGLEPRQIQDSARWQPGYVDKAKAAKEAAS